MCTVIKGVELDKSEYVTLKYLGSNISDEIFACAIIIDSSGNRLFETGDYIAKPEFDLSGNLTGLVLGLLVCVKHKFKNIILEGVLDMESEPGFFEDLFSEFENVSKNNTVQNDDDDLLNLITDICLDKKAFYRDKID